MIEEGTLNRFLPKVSFIDECWVWTGATGGRGQARYGILSHQGKMRMATHVSLWLFKGVELPLKQGQQVLHALRAVCVGPRCVNPDHLRVGSAKENAADRTPDGTSLHGDRNPMRANPLLGSKDGNAKLTESQVLEIYNSTESPTAVARRYGVKYRTVWEIRNGRTWGWLTRGVRGSFRRTA